MRIGLYISAGPATPIDAILARFERAEAEGFATAWAGQVFDHDALTLLALAARATRRIELGSWVVPAPLRHPAVLAQQALTVQAASGGRLALGVGVSHEEVVARRFGERFEHPVRHMREYLDLLTPLLAGARVQHAGERYRVSLQLGSLGTDPPPVLLAALGPAMLRLAGAAADGAAIWLGSRRYLETFAVPHLREAARAAGRPAPRIACGFPIAVTRDLAPARAGAEALLARSSKLPAYRRVLERGGLARPSDAAIVGDEDAVARELEALAGIGVTDLNAVPFAVEGDPEAPARTQALLAGVARSGGC
ncbi:MAG TPA: TIGR03564 family F420-dependent LLM class oxidoreductase [Myxococcota bacterium]|jgi:F420-dependent oxidoreductase-like protein